MIRRDHPTSGDPAYRLLFLNRALTRVSQYEERVVSAEHELSPTQGHALGELWRAGDLSMGELAERLRVTRSTATRIVDLLERKKLVQRHMASNDRRRQRVRLTPRGEMLYEGLEAHALHVHRRILHHVSWHERDGLLTALSNLLDAHEKTIRTIMPPEGS